MCIAVCTCGRHFEDSALNTRVIQSYTMHLESTLKDGSLDFLFTITSEVDPAEIVSLNQRKVAYYGMPFNPASN